MRLILLTIPILTLLTTLASVADAAKTTLVEAGGRVAISTEAANTGGGTTQKHFLNSYRTSLIRQDGKIEKVSLYVASKPASVTAFFFEVWRKNGETWDRVSQEDIWPSVTGGQINDITLKAAPLAQEGDFIGCGYTCTSDPGLFLTAATDPELYDPAGAYNNKSYSVTDAAPSAKSFNWDEQTPLMLYVPIKVYMQPPVMVFTGDSIISGAPGHLSFVDTYFPLAYPGRPAVPIDPSTTIPYKVGKALKVSYQNMAMAGATSHWVLQNVFNDCIKLKPKIMLIGVGVNDVSTSSDKAGFLANYTTMLNACLSNNIQPVVNLIMPRTDLSDAKARELDDWNVSLIDLAKRYGAVIVDARSAVGQFREGGDPGNIWALKLEYAADIVHFKPAGHTKIAEVMVETIKKAGILEGSAVKPRPLAKAGTWQTSVVRQMNGPGKEIKLPGLFQAVTQDWNCEVAQPHIVYIPEKNRVLMLEGMKMPYQAVLTYSDDWGATWSKPRLLHTDAAGKCDVGHSLGLTYLGDGKLIMTSSSRWFSSDYGETWEKWADVPPGIGGAGWGLWDPMLVDRDPVTGKATRLMEGPHTVDNNAYYSEHGNDCSQGYVWFSTDEGKTWTPPAKVPQWKPVNETTFVRAKNGDIVAACRIDYPAKFRKELNDNYGGVGVSISKDNGVTWSKVKMLYQWGRHHASLVCMPNGDIVMCYLVRKGYRFTPDGRPRFGIEAIVSRDNGKTWDLDHKYILTQWDWPYKSPLISAWGGPCGTSSVVLPDGSILTTFRTGRRAVPRGNDRYWPQDAELVRWRLNYDGLKEAHAISDAAPTSDLRNKFAPDFHQGAPTGKKNIAVLKEGAKVTASEYDGNLSDILYDEYYSYARINLKTIPGWVQISWPKAHKISEARIFAGNDPEFANDARECIPLDYKLQYKKGEQWVDLIPPVTNAPMWKDFAATVKQGDEFFYTHTFAPVSTKAIRMYVTKTSSPNSKDTYIRMIEVF